MRRILLALGTLLVMTGSAYGFDLEKLCGDFTALQNPDTKVYRGEWQRTYPSNPNPLPVALVVIETTKSNRVMLWHVVKRRRGRELCHPMFGRISGRRLDARTHWRGTKLRYAFDGEGGATIQYVGRDRDGNVTREWKGKLQLDK